MRILRLLPLSTLLLCACDKSGDVEGSGESDLHITTALKRDPEPSEEELAAVEAKIEKLEREIENSTNLISDMEAFILMERAKVDDNTDYDQSFMEEALADQDEQREIIKQAREQLKELTGSEE